LPDTVEPMVRAEELVPPASDLEALTSYASKRNFMRAGRRFRAAAIDCGLKPGHRVLDLGCGPGRLAVALSGYLDDRGSYVGLDVSRDAIDICDRWIGAKLPRFEFVWADVFNARYNKAAGPRATEYRFPFEDGSFDFVFSNSLFTHLLPADARHYVCEIGRVLKRGGRTLNTIFLLNAESLSLIEGEGSRHKAPHVVEEVARVKDPERPEAWIALDETYIRDAHRRAGLHIEEIRYGAWPGRDATGVGFGKKDGIVAVKH
jgi:ubiquinone/menaquinone biosynthesis C-methylase UbiE